MLFVSDMPVKLMGSVAVHVQNSDKRMHDYNLMLLVYFGSRGDSKMNICVFSVHIQKQHLFSGELFDISKTGEIF